VGASQLAEDCKENMACSCQGTNPDSSGMKFVGNQIQRLIETSAETLNIPVFALGRKAGSTYVKTYTKFPNFD